MKKLMTGNEAVARGAYEAGLKFASAYPGTPSTEILENMIQYKEDIFSEWAPNEKVALEAAIGASVAGARSMAAMKHVGLNVAADPLFTFAYTGVTGGCVIVSADDPGMHSSQNEQDNRNYAAAARVLMLEPSDSQESKDYMKLAFELSERFDTPVLMRMTTRVCHSKGLVTLGERVERELIPYKHNIQKYVATPANGKVLRKKLIDRLKNMEAYSNETEINKVEYNGTEIGIISAGVAYQYAREVFGDDASYLKLGMTFPMPIAKIKEFAGKVKKLYVIEEMDPYIENHLKAAGISCIGKDIIPEMDELNTDIVRKAVFGTVTETLKTEKEAIGRPPVLCAGCPHRGMYYALSKKKNLLVTGDIGCYTLGSAPPLSSLHTCFCMGGSISSGHGASTVLKRGGSDLRVAAIIGDSTFLHSGITSLMDVVYNKGNNVTIILDNRITAMTGHQENPGTGFTLMGEPTTEVDIPMLCRAIGIKDENLYIINPLHLTESGEVVDEALAKDEPTVIIAKWPCVLKKFSDQDKREFDLSPKSCVIDQDKCTKCRLCVKTGCPAINSGEIIEIDPESCTGCTVCMQVCPFDAIREV
ncbi:MAG: indolepyruvate ferredoxin oxidoreductase subunit alpha [Eubacteriales bacterium]|nr:indolepyruvate ferredoxin oxidoreductase subunit alpha [Eubacteriales bacterium]MDD3199071.1 indolepyruvate ferredoxin oxidoreductase subunit alpha [Eubacteriales bacterium]MDD4629443.1 indolepyruvate ferredoxin oxidoreductase subunit alpha [Eubacteriales bacterium]